MLVLQMDLSIINKIKYSNVLYNIYYHLGSIGLNILKWIVKPHDNLIVINSFGGRKFDDSTKVIYNLMIQDPFFKDFDIVWAFMNPDKFEIPVGRKIKSDTFRYFITLLKARIWISNSGLERGLDFKGRKTFYLNTWHGTPIKKMGSDIDEENPSMKGKSHSQIVDIMLAQGNYDKEIFTRVFINHIKNMKITGLPRNDELVEKDKPEVVALIKQKLGIHIDKKVILYAPTFREYDKDEGSNCILSVPIDFGRWENELGKEYILLLRAHYEVTKNMNIPNSDFVKDVSLWPDLNELMLVSDMLISDYSSIFFDFAITGKPMLTYCYDYDRYASKRGMYFDIRKELDTSDLDSQDKILEEIKNERWKRRSEITKNFRAKYITEYGKGAEKAIEEIKRELNANQLNA